MIQLERETEASTQATKGFEMQSIIRYSERVFM